MYHSCDLLELQVSYKVYTKTDRGKHGLAFVFSSWFHGMMFQTIGEAISVAGVYDAHTFVPKKFQWKKKVYLIEEITLISEIRDGQIKKRLYSVLCGKQLYRLLFNRATEHWTLEELWVE